MECFQHLATGIQAGGSDTPLRRAGQGAKVSRYDYDPLTGDLSNETPVAEFEDAPNVVVGLGFHGTNLYTTSDHGQGDDRISRWFDADDDGLYESRHDFVSDDFLYKKVRLGDEGEFPPAGFGFSEYIQGNPITNLVNLGVSPSPGGFDFIQDGPDAGKVILGNLGATRTNWLGRDLWLVDATTGTHQPIYQFSTNSNAYAVSDVIRDPYGRFVISDYGHAAIWRLTPPLPQPGLSVLRTGLQIQLSWPLTAVDHALQETLDPRDPNAWTSGAAVPEISTNGIRASVTASNTARFFRLTGN